MNIREAYGVGAPRVYNYKTVVECVNPELIIGLELETEGCDARSGEEWLKGTRPFNIEVKTDGSLRGVAYEFISRPMRSDAALGALTDFFEFSKFTEANYSDRCSVHVHVNCTNLELEHVASLALLYTTVEELLFEFVGGSRDTNIYCIPWNQCRQHLDLINKFLSDSGGVLKRWNKYTALNLIPLSSLGTVEFRQMHGTSDMKKLTKWINIIGALFKEATSRELKDLITEIKALNSTSQYETFFNRVLGGQLPYNQVYREKLEAGVIFAKYSLVSMEKKRTKPSAQVKEATVLPEGARVRVRADGNWLDFPVGNNPADEVGPMRVRPNRVVVNPFAADAIAAEVALGAAQAAHQAAVYEEIRQMRERRALRNADMQVDIEEEGN